MSDVVKDFDAYLVTWCKENHKPLPKVMNKYWKEAWESYMKNVLVDKWEENKEAYWNIPLLTKAKAKELDFIPKQEDDINQEEVSETQDNWSKIQKFLK